MKQLNWAALWFRSEEAHLVFSQSAKIMCSVLRTCTHKQTTHTQWADFFTFQDSSSDWHETGSVQGAEPTSLRVHLQQPLQVTVSSVVQLEALTGHVSLTPSPPSSHPPPRPGLMLPAALSREAWARAVICDGGLKVTSGSAQGEEEEEVDPSADEGRLCCFYCTSLRGIRSVWNTASIVQTYWEVKVKWWMAAISLSWKFAMVGLWIHFRLISRL